MTPTDGIAYERSDAEPWLLGVLAAGTAAFLVLAPLSLALVYQRAVHQPSTQRPPIAHAAPRLQTDAPHDLATLRRAEDERLSSYGWIDREQRTVHLPIERAMSRIEERGLPGWQRAP